MPKTGPTANFRFGCSELTRGAARREAELEHTARRREAELERAARQLEEKLALTTQHLEESSKTNGMLQARPRCIGRVKRQAKFVLSEAFTAC